MIEGTVGHRAGVVLGALAALVMIADGVAGLLRPELMASVMASDGWGSETLRAVALLALVSGVLHAIPRTALLAQSSSPGLRAEPLPRICV